MDLRSSHPTGGPQVRDGCVTARTDVAAEQAPVA